MTGHRRPRRRPGGTPPRRRPRLSPRVQGCPRTSPRRWPSLCLPRQRHWKPPKRCTGISSNNIIRTMAAIRTPFGAGVSRWTPFAAMRKDLRVMTTSPSSPIWSPQKQERWAATQRGDPALLHILLDASGSMDGYQDALRRSYNLYLHTLQRAAHPLTVLDTRSFGTTLQAPAPQALGAAPDLTHATYTASYGGTALYD